MNQHDLLLTQLIEEDSKSEDQMSLVEVKLLEVDKLKTFFFSGSY